ncbi:hypothetical protein ACFLUA_01030 [Chloroflexota bacterium]
MGGGVFGFSSIDIINIVIFSRDITLRIFLINPVKDYVAAVFCPTEYFIHFRITSILNRWAAWLGSREKCFPVWKYIIPFIG